MRLPTSGRATVRALVRTTPNSSSLPCDPKPAPALAGVCDRGVGAGDVHDFGLALRGVARIPRLPGSFTHPERGGASGTRRPGDGIDCRRSDLLDLGPAIRRPHDPRHYPDLPAPRQNEAVG